MGAEIDFKTYSIGYGQIDTMAFNIYQDIGEYINRKSSHFNKWLLYEIVTDAINELKPEGYKIENNFC